MPQKFHKLFAAVTGAALLCAMTVPALAADETPATDPNAGNAVVSDTAAQAPYALGPTRAVVQAPAEGDQLRVLADAEDGAARELVLNLDENTVVAALADGAVGKVADLKKDQEVYLYTSPATTRSLPPQTYAYAILTGVKEHVVPPQLQVVEKVLDKSEGLGGSTVTASYLCDHGGMMIYFETDTPLTTAAGTAATAADFQVGSSMLAWYDVVMESYPGQAYATRALLLPGAAAPDAASAEGNETPAASADGADLTIVIDGDMVLPVKGKLENGVAMVPVRAVGEALGCAIDWDPANKISVTHDVRTMTITVGEDLYVSAATQSSGLVGMTAPQTLGAAPYYDEQGSTWAPAALFQVLQGFTVTLNGTELTIA